MRFEELTGATVVIWGAGREGRAALAELGRRGVGAVVAVTGDGAVPDDLAPVAVTGDAAVAALESADAVVKSPGVPHTEPQFLRLRELGVTVTSLTDLWLSANPDRVIGVTGTKGKSTTSSLIHHVLGGVGLSASLVGNGGTPVTAGDTGEAQVAVTEVSSYQAADLTASPRVAVVTSLYPEHLPWHGGYERYVADKLNLLAHGPEAVVVPSAGGELARLAASRLTADTRLIAPFDMGIAFSDSGLSWDGIGSLGAAEIPVRGLHNLGNVALALTAVTAYADLDRDGRIHALESLRTFAPLEHRLEHVPSDDDRTWVDDSLATAPEAVVAALRAYPGSRVTLLAGGADRGLAFAPLLSYLATRSPGTGAAAARAVDVIAVGPAGKRLLAEAGDALPGARLAPSFATALAWAREDGAAHSDVVLLSPGAPSFDEFASYEERSAAFRAAAAGDA
ncbi:UDP-N-acetylmuramoyl-L-alanine--D-glutamate ligase [Nocardioides sp. YIM 152588]|uniref:UDP-N-acetylmuramoyl-L-alanine--D-glutamate ligase n=1 Tax=Nocardioides sp. YIM 152588 TaxID=3158259 RepID=UPI0032E4FA84